MTKTPAFRDFLYPNDDPRLAPLKGMDAYQYRESARRDDFTGGLIRNWTPLYFAPFVGVTSDGDVAEGLYPLTLPKPGEAAPTEAMTAAAQRFLRGLTSTQVEQVTFAVDAPDWQTWANPEFMQHDTGLRLEALDSESRSAFLAIVEASLSPDGSRLVRDLMRINAYLGEVVGLQGIMNEYSYNVAIYGEPSGVAPWGWQLFGHHVALNCLVVEGRMVATPVFLGSEPDVFEVDGVITEPVFDDRIEHALALMSALTPQLRNRVISFEHIVDDAMPPGRIDPGDERHLAGAFQDNRVIPFEGVRVREFGPAAREAVIRVIDDFIAYLPDGPRAARRREILGALDETWFSWIGGHSAGDVFYFRLQSNVVVLEFDQHTGVFLSNTAPQPFHVHTVMRTPNGNDYGRSYLRQFESKG